MYCVVLNAEFKNATYLIKDASVDNELMVFRGRYIGNTDFTNENKDNLKVGGEVLIKGKLQKYVKNNVTTPEIAQNNYIVSYTQLYAVTFASSGNGSIAVRVSGGLINSGTYVNDGASLAIVATPNQGYKIASVTANGVALSGEDGNYAYTIDAQDVTIDASFEEDKGTGFEDVETSAKAVKLLRNGILLIEKNGHTYNAMGQLVK